MDYWYTEILTFPPDITKPFYLTIMVTLKHHLYTGSAATQLPLCTVCLCEVQFSAFFLLNLSLKHFHLKAVTDHQWFREDVSLTLGSGFNIREFYLSRYWSITNSETQPSVTSLGVYWQEKKKANAKWIRLGSKVLTDSKAIIFTDTFLLNFQNNYRYNLNYIFKLW